MNEISRIQRKKSDPKFDDEEYIKKLESQMLSQMSFETQQNAAQIQEKK